MKILLTCQFFNYCSGSAMYVHNLALELVKRGHEVTILSETGGDIKRSAQKNGVRVIDFSQTFDITEEKFDIIHANQLQPCKLALTYWADTPFIFTIHSELSSIEKPMVHPSIKEYVAVRQSIFDKYKDLNPVLIPIGVPFDRFNHDADEKIKQVKKEVEEKEGPQKKIVLFVGTIDHLRQKVLRDLEKRSVEEDFELWIVGRNFLNLNFNNHVRVVPETFFVEKFYEMADETAGILMGTTVCESWACGKPYRWYEVDDKGDILGEPKLLDVPADISMYSMTYMTDRYEELYKKHA